MSVRNNTDSRYANEKNRFTLSISDTNDHDFPDVDGDDGTAGSAYNVGSGEEVVAKVVNNQDQSLTARLEGAFASDHDSFSENNNIVSGVSVSSGGGTSSLVWRQSNDGNYHQLRVVVSFGTAPSGNSDTVVEFRKSQ